MIRAAAAGRTARRPILQRADELEARIPRGALAGLAALAAGYLVLFAALSGLPYQDIPNHLARAIVIGDLVFDGGRRFGEQFVFTWAAVPYVLGDLLLLPLVRILPADVAGRAWVILEWLSLPLGVLALARAWRWPKSSTVLALAFSLYLATDVFFTMGFANFRMGLGLMLAALAGWEEGLATGRARAWAAYAACAAGAYLMHLAALAFLVAAVGVVSALRLLERRERFVRLAAAGLPIVLLLAWHVLAREPADPSPALQPSAWGKLIRLGSSQMRWRDAPDTLLFLGFALPVAAAALLVARGPRSDRARELAALSGAFLGLYFVMPEAKGALWAIDNRALSLAWLFLALLAAEAAPRRGWTAPLAAGAFAIAGANLVLLAARLVPDDRYMRDYRALLVAVPRGAVVLPVLTQPKRGYTNTVAHASSFATIDRDAVVPYTFSGDVGMPMHYFRFRHRPPAPPQFWYQAGYAPPGGARALDRFPYLLVDLPADWTRIPVDGRVVARNRAVALLETRTALASAGRGDGERR
jgi:hypothetical protein